MKADGIHPQDLHALIREEQHLARHGLEDRRIGIVEVPLEVVETFAQIQRPSGSCTNDPA